MGFGKKLKKFAHKNKIGQGANKLFGPKSWRTGAMIGAGILGGKMLFGGPKAAVGAGPSSSHFPGQELVGGGIDAGTITRAGVPGSAGSLLGRLAPGLIGAAGSIYAAKVAAGGVESANEASVASAREQMAFQEQMSSTAHQREVEDLKLAGLNPVLSANSGASTPVGQSVDYESAAPNYSGVVASAIAAKAAQKDFEEIDSRILMNQGSRVLMREQARAADANARVLEATEKRINAERYITDLENDFLRKNPKYIDWKKRLELLGSGVGSAKSAVSAVKDAKSGPSVSEEFGPKGEHRRTTIRSR